MTDQATTPRPRILVWLKDDLRLHDSPAVMAAMSEPNGGVVLLRTREGACSHVRPTMRRIAREDEAIASMRRVLMRAGVELHEAEPGVEDVMRFAGRHAIGVIHANMKTSDDAGHRRDRRLRAAARDVGIRLVEHPVDGVARGSGTTPGRLVTGARDIPGISFDALPDAMTRLRQYLGRLPSANYRRDMWTPGPDARASSRLSVDLACGALSGDRVLHEIERAVGAADPRDHNVYQAFADRIHWRRGFVQMLESNMGAFRWAPGRDEDDEDRRRMAAWLGGRTGYPLVDAAMTDLAATGWINFRLRQLLCSFAIDLLGLDMHRVGVALGGLFDDYAPGIHWCQMALQSGMVPGRGPRVLNPVKQATDLDPDGRYVRRILPWMEKVPPDRVIEPWTWPGYAGPPPIVDHMAAARQARARYPSTKRKAADHHE